MLDLDHPHGHSHAAVAIAPESGGHFIAQDWGSYTAEQHDVWSILYDRRMRALEETASRVFLEGASTIGLARHRVPDLTDVNAPPRSTHRVGRGFPSTAFFPHKEFFEAASRFAGSPRP